MFTSMHDENTIPEMPSIMRMYRHVLYDDKRSICTRLKMNICTMLFLFYYSVTTGLNIFYFSHIYIRQTF